MSTIARIHFSPDGPIPLPGSDKPKIRAFSGPAEAAQPIEASWKRPLIKTGAGATHVRTFTAKMTPASLEYLDKHINEWLDAHPDAEVKFSTMQVGDMAGSMGKETAVIVQVWI